MELTWRLIHVDRKICTGISAGLLRTAKITTDAFFNTGLLIGLSPLLKTEECIQLLLLWLGLRQKNCLPSPHFINQPVHCSELPLHCRFSLAAYFNHLLTCSGLLSSWIARALSRGLKKLLGHFLVAKHSPCPCVQRVSKCSRLVLLSHSGSYWSQVLGYLQEEPRALPGWEKVMDYRHGSYSEFLGSRTYKGQVKGGQGLLLEMVQQGFSAARGVLSVCTPIFIMPVISFARLICNNDNIVKACPFKEGEPFES